MRRLAKAAASAFCRLTVLPTFLAYRLTALFVDADKAFHGASQRAALWPGIVGEYRRREFYRLTLDECSDDCCLSFGTIFSKRHARVGRRAYVGTHCNLGLVSLGDDVLLASGVDVLSGSGQHQFEDPEKPVREQGGEFKRVSIGFDTWIGNRTVVMADVGSRCVIGAGSIVTGPLPDRSVAVGVPARIVGERGAKASRERETSLT
ncbi:acyltransferase [bacterium]|nr:acyltransferase [bacterium]